ncbi:unnamed protein product [Amoebophrya sp. A120]|nr:unnamed protein product [Amoebophrya sp. A120]|eukprot:GSA120T00008635001.1
MMKFGLQSAAAGNKRSTFLRMPLERRSARYLAGSSSYYTALRLLIAASTQREELQEVVAVSYCGSCAEHNAYLVFNTVTGEGIGWGMQPHPLNYAGYNPWNTYVNCASSGTNPWNCALELMETIELSCWAPPHGDQNGEDRCEGTKLYTKQGNTMQYRDVFFDRFRDDEGWKVDSGGHDDDWKTKMAPYLWDGTEKWEKHDGILQQLHAAAEVIPGANPQKRAHHEVPFFLAEVVATKILFLGCIRTSTCTSHASRNQNSFCPLRNVDGTRICVAHRISQHAKVVKLNKVLARPLKALQPPCDTVLNFLSCMINVGVSLFSLL